MIEEVAAPTDATSLHVRVKPDGWVQFLSLAITAGGIVATATYFIVSAINTVAQTDREALSAMDRRVTTLEVEYLADSRTLDHLSTLMDQERAASDDLATAIARLQIAIERTGRR